MSKTILTTQETVRLCELERIIQKGKDTFVEVGTSLSEIRHAKLYVASHGTFEEYCEKRWDMGKSHVNRLMEAARIVETIKTSPMGEVIPTSERQARPLAKLPAAEQPAAWTKAQEKAKDEGKPVAARHVEEAVAEVMPKAEHETVVMGGTKEEPKDSERISLLKSTWNKASKREKVAFAAWINRNWKL